LTALNFKGKSTRKKLLNMGKSTTVK